MKPIFCILFALFPSIMFAQRLHADLYAGVANYQGDLQAKKFTFNGAGPAFGLGLSYDISNRFMVRTLLTSMRVSGQDKPGVPAYDFFTRNLNFKTRILEGQLTLEFNILDIEERGFSPYLFAGVAVFGFNPYTFDSTGKKEYLRPLGTEGQGLPQYPEKKLYSTTEVAIPFGAGVKFLLAERLQLGIEVNMRKLFTDYLDDVSGTYADSSILAAARGAQAASLAYRGNEAKGDARYPQEGFNRGNPKSNDLYYTTGVKLSYSFGGNGNGSRGARRSRTGCPVNVY